VFQANGGDFRQGQSDSMTNRELLRLVRSIVLLKRRTRKIDCRKLSMALDTAGYYAGLMLGQKLMEEREWRSDGEKLRDDR
jgi:hypothetical protein